MKNLRVIIAVLVGLPALGWADDLYHLTFSGTARLVNELEQVEASRLTARHLMARCVGTNELGTNHPFQLVYNSTRDRIQVVNGTNGVIMCDVMEFQTRFSNENERRLERLAFVFVPEETNSVGSAVIYEQLNHRPGRISLSGRAQFVLSSIDSASSNARFDDSATTNNAVQLSSLSVVPTASSSPTNTIPGIPSPGTLLSTTNMNTGDTNVPSLPSPGTLLDTTNNPSIGLTNGVGVPGLPASPGTLLDTTNSVSTTNNVGTTNVVSVPGIPGGIVGSTNSTGVVTTPSVPVVTSPGTATNGVAEAISLVGTNVVICTGNFSAGRKLRVPTNDSE